MSVASAPSPRTPAKRLRDIGERQTSGSESSARLRARALWGKLREEFAPKPRNKPFLGDVILETVRDLRRMRTQRVQDTSTWQSINYSFVDNAPQREHIHQLTDADTRKLRRTEFLLMMLIGLAAGVSTMVLTVAIDHVLSAKTKLVMEHWRESPALAWALLVVPNALLFGAAAAVVLFLTPAAGGSGIPEVKAYLNGVQLPTAWGPQVFVTKVVSCALACSSGLPVGPEGPIIYLGGNIGRFLSSEWLISRLGVPYTDDMQRTAMTLGVAAGVASAFHAPIGALLFVVEEVASIFTTSMLWSGFLCTLTSFFVTEVGKHAISGTHFETAGIFNSGQVPQWELSELPNFIILGLMLGLLGACFNVVNVKLVNSRYRKKIICKSKHRQVFEVAAVAFVLSTIWFFLPYLVACRSKEADFPQHIKGTSKARAQELMESTKDLWCEDPEEHFNPLASLMFGSLEEVGNYYFLPLDDDAPFYPFPEGVMMVFTLLFGIGTCYIAGSSMATGIFIPMILIGAGTGRFYAVLIKAVFPYLAHIDPAAYAVCGAAGFVSGVSRISVAITVIMIEISHNLNLLMPIMLTVGVAKYTGDCLTEPYFEMVLHMRHVPFVEPEPSVLFSQLRCYQVMQRPVTCLLVEAKVLDVLKALADTPHNGFPVVESRKAKKLHGIITRDHLQFMLNNLDRFLSEPDSALGPSLRNHYGDTHHSLRSFHDIIDSVDPRSFGRTIDLQPWMSRAPVTIHHTSPMEQAFHTFRAFGLRQLLVVNSDYCVVGMLTRHELYHVQHDPDSYQDLKNQEHDNLFFQLWQKVRRIQSRERRAQASVPGPRLLGAVLKTPTDLLAVDDDKRRRHD